MNAVSANDPVAAGTNPFSPRVVLAMVLFGAGVFVALLWMIGAGMTHGSANNGEAHVGSKGLTGYAALADLLERQGHAVRRAQSIALLKDPGLVVLTPPMWTDGKALEKIIQNRRTIGPTMLVLPKWQAIPAKALQLGAKDGWVQIAGTHSPDWLKDLGQYKLTAATSANDKNQDQVKKGPPVSWSGLGETGNLPDPRIQFDRSDFVVPLVIGGDGSVLAGYWNDHGDYPALVHAAGNDGQAEDEDVDETLYPLLIVDEPDLLNNWGMADENRAKAALELVRLAEGGKPAATINFDMTLNGFKRSPNLLTLAFTPPFLAATLCLLIAALVAGWRAFRRFGPPLAQGRVIAFGKAALVANSAGLIRRAGRMHLLAAPYAALVRERLARTLALPRQTDPERTEAAIDRALSARDPQAKPFSRIATELRGANRPAELLRAGQALQDVERILTR